MAGPPSKDVTKLFEQYGATVYRRALRLLGKHEDAEEATQEVFGRGIRGMDGFEDRSSMTTWMYQITTNYCLDLLRQRVRRRRLFEQNVQASEENKEVSASDLVHLQRLLSEADPQQARAVVCVYLDGMSHERAAEVLGVSKRTVGNHIDRFLSWAQSRGGSSSSGEIAVSETVPSRVKGS